MRTKWGGRCVSSTQHEFCFACTDVSGCVGSFSLVIERQLSRSLILTGIWVTYNDCSLHNSSVTINSVKHVNFATPPYTDFQHKAKRARKRNRITNCTNLIKMFSTTSEFLQYAGFMLFLYIITKSNTQFENRFSIK